MQHKESLTKNELHYFRKFTQRCNEVGYRYYIISSPYNQIVFGPKFKTDIQLFESETRVLIPDFSCFWKRSWQSLCRENKKSRSLVMSRP